MMKEENKLSKNCKKNSTMLALEAIEHTMQPGGLSKYGKRAIDLKKVLRKQYILSTEGCKILVNYQWRETCYG